MRELGPQGPARGRTFETTIGDDPTARARDPMDRDFTATRSNQLWVAELTYVATRRGFVYVAFVIDTYARRIVGWRAPSARGAIWRSMRSSRRSTRGPAATPKG